MTVSFRLARALVLPSALLAGATLAACEGCRGRSSSAPASSPPTVRLYLLSTVAGALEPCGCSKNQLGGFDHFGAYVRAEATHAPASLVAEAGPLFFLDPQRRGDQAAQDDAKAQAIADSLAKLGMAAFAPGANDWCDGAKGLDELRTRSSTSIVAANLAGQTAGAVPWTMKEAGGLKIALLGVSTPLRMGVPPDGVELKPPAEALHAAIADAKAKGAQVLVGLFALRRGDALRLVENAPELQVAVIGKPFDQGEANDKPADPVLLGKTLVVQPSNHLQTVSVVDLFVRDGKLDFQDAAGIAKSADRAILVARIDELRAKIRTWEQSPGIKKEDLDARKADLAKAIADLRQLETPPPPAQGSFFRVTLQEIRQDLGRDDPVYKEMLEYYDEVNEHNRKAFADRTPKPPGPDGNKYIGVQACAACHAAAKTVWDGTPHAHAYETLASQHKQFNLDCVSCHVTGYEQPGGSTVTHVSGLEAVQCEDCHGPGGKHRDNPTDKSLLVGHPKPEACVGSCHHPPHVEGFDPVAQMHRILGPGHGNPANWPPLAASPPQTRKNGN